MNISQFRTFAMVVEYGSFSSAARAMHLSQPAVTMQVQALEAEFDATLLDRKYRKVELTEAGRVLLSSAQHILTAVEEAHDEISALSGTVTGRLLLAASTTPGQYVLPGLLGTFLDENPEVGVSLSVFDTRQVVEAVESGKAHLGMTGAEIPGSKVHFEHLGADELVMICPPDHELAGRSGLRISDVVEEPFILREEGSGTRIVTEGILRGVGIDPGDLRSITELSTGEAVVSAVEGGMGLAVVSRRVADKAICLKSVEVIGVDKFPIDRPFFVVRPRGTLTCAADAFLDLLRKELAFVAAD